MTGLVKVRLVRMSDPDETVFVWVIPDDVDRVRGCVFRAEGTPEQEQMRTDMRERIIAQLRKEGDG